MKVTSTSLLLLTCLVGVAWGRSPFVQRSTLRREIVPKAVLDLRGGSSKARKKGKTSRLSSRTATGKKKVQAAEADDKKSSSPTKSLVSTYKQILPLTRIYITLVAVVTLSGLVLGEETAQGLLALDPMRVMYGMEYWRPITAASFLGPPSVGWVFTGYYLIQYGSSLERAYGTPQHLIFLLTQLVCLSVASALFGQPFFCSSVVTAMLHVLSRAMPNQKVNLLVFPVPYWLLPCGLMVVDVLQANNVAAAIPHVLGILTGHIYHFHKFIWPKMGGEDWLVAPDFLIRRLNPQAKRDSAKEAVKEALSKSRKRGKGRKLGGSSKKKK